MLLKLRPLLGLAVSRLRSRTEQEICVFRYTECSSYYSWALAKCIRWSKYCTHHAGPQNNVLAHIMHTSCTHPAGQQNNVLAHIMVETCLHLPRLASTCLAQLPIAWISGFPVAADLPKFTIQYNFYFPSLPWHQARPSSTALKRAAGPTSATRCSRAPSSRLRLL